MTFEDALTLLVSLFAILNPVSVSAAYLTMTKHHTYEEIRKIPLNFTIAIIIIMLISVWLGELFLKIFGLTLPAFQLAGGLVLLSLGLSMIFPKTIDAGVSTKKTSDIVSIAVVPLAIPIGAGPGVIAFLIENSERYHSLMGKLCLTFICLLVCIAAGMILFYARTISKKMGDTGVQTLSRVVGLIIASLGTGMLARAITGFFPSIH